MKHLLAISYLWFWKSSLLLRGSLGMSWDQPVRIPSHKGLLRWNTFSGSKLTTRSQDPIGSLIGLGWLMTSLSSWKYCLWVPPSPAISPQDTGFQVLWRRQMPVNICSVVLICSTAIVDPGRAEASLHRPLLGENDWKSESLWLEFWEISDLQGFFHVWFPSFFLETTSCD